MDSDTLVLQDRTISGSQACRRMRQEGNVPGVFYGLGKENFSVTVDGDHLRKLIGGDTPIVALELNGEADHALIKEVQYDALGDEILHVDLVRVDMNVEVEISVTLETKGRSPAMDEGGILETPLKELTVRCLPKDVPASILVDISEVEMGGALYVRDLEIPEGVTTEVDPDSAVLMIKEPVEEEEIDEVEEGASPTEPELIRPEGRGDDEEGEGDAE